MMALLLKHGADTAAVNKQGETALFSACEEAGEEGPSPLALDAVLFLLEPSDPLAIAGISLVAVIWLSTAFIQVPCHNRLVDGFDEEAHSRLVGSNWIRTVAWTIRGVLSLAMLSCGSIS